ncbi:MAG: C4-dicarboxylate transporter [Planctomycetota bacterium]|nr:MAG: C4-dicarboxylate transporter [Planctomycetota bacterium]
MITASLVLALLVLLALRVPLFVILGTVTVAGYLVSGEVTRLLDAPLIERIRELTDKPPLLAIPFFVLSGTIMARGAIARRLVDVASALFSFVPGGLGIATVAACMFFAAISGSSPATVITIGSVMYPALVAQGYRERFANGLVTSAGTLGILIPPSIPMIVYAIFASATTIVQVEDLFLAGLGPGLLIGGMFMVYCAITGRLKGERLRLPRPREVARAMRKGIWALMLPVLILGGIYSGLFTATEAAAVSVVYALGVELVIHRELRLEDIPRVFGEATVLMGSLLVIFAMAVGLNGLFADLELPQRAAAWLAAQELTPVGFLLALNGLLLLVGCVMDIMSAIMILVPLLAPMGDAMGIDPIHLGVVFIVNLELGYLTPPLGLNLFVSSTLFGTSLGAVIRAVAPFTAILLLALLIVTYVPTVSLGPVNLLKGRPFYAPFPEARPSAAEPGAPAAPAARPGVRTLEELMRGAAYRSIMDEDEGEPKPEQPPAPGPAAEPAPPSSPPGDGGAPPAPPAAGRGGADR